MKTPRAPWLTVLPGVVAVYGVLAAASLLLGAEHVSLAQAWTDWRAGLSLADSPDLSILVQQRLPRTLAALIAGAGLALAGCSFQALLRNPLATPYTLGVASWASLGAWAATVLIYGYGYPFWIFGLPTVELAAFLFAAANVTVIYLLAIGKARMAPTVLLLAGVTMGMIANSGILFMRYLADPERLVVMDRWLMGGVDVLGFGPVAGLLAGVIPCSILLLLQSPKFDQLGFGEELAAGRGVNVRQLQIVTFFTGSLMTAIIVAKVGPIGFVGLIVPHAVRGVVGSRHRLLMPLSLLAGGAFLCLCDIVARRVLPGETPIGIITTLIGGPFFIYLLVRRRFTDWQT